MRIQELLVESEQLDEGPLSAIGTGLGKVAGGAAKAVGAVAGGVAGLGSAFKKGYQSGKSTVAGDEEPAAAAPADDAAPADAGGGAAPAPAAPAAAPAAKPKSAFDRLNTAANSGTKAPAGAAPAAAAPAAEPAGANASPAMGQMANQLAGEKPNTMANAPVSKTNTAKPGNPNAAAPAADPAAAPNPKADTAYAQAQKAVQGLPPEQQKEIVTMLQADPKVKAAMTAKAPKAAPAGKAPAADAGAAPAAPQEFPKKANGSTMNYHPETGEKFATPADAQAYLDKRIAADPTYGQPKAKTAAPAAEPAAPAAEPAAPAPAATPTAAPAAEPTAAPATPTPKAADADATDAGKPGFLQSKIKGRRPPAGPSQAEIDADRERLMGKFTDSVERHKKAMTESAIRTGELSFYRKR